MHLRLEGERTVDGELGGRPHAMEVSWHSSRPETGAMEVEVGGSNPRFS